MNDRIDETCDRCMALSVTCHKRNLSPTTTGDTECSANTVITTLCEDCYENHMQAERRKEKFRIEIKHEPFFDEVAVNVSHNGFQWAGQRYTLEELRMLHKALGLYLMPNGGKPLLVDIHGNLCETGPARNKVKS